MNRIAYSHAVEDCSEYWKMYTWYNCGVYDYGRYLEDLEDVNAVNQGRSWLVGFEGEAERGLFAGLFFKEGLEIGGLAGLN